jgi:hypothetical protein
MALYHGYFPSLLIGKSHLLDNKYYNERRRCCCQIFLMVVERMKKGLDGERLLTCKLVCQDCAPIVEIRLTSCPSIYSS